MGKGNEKAKFGTNEVHSIHPEKDEQGNYVSHDDVQAAYGTEAYDALYKGRQAYIKKHTKIEVVENSPKHVRLHFIRPAGEKGIIVYNRNYNDDELLKACGRENDTILKKQFEDSEHIGDIVNLYLA